MAGMTPATRPSSKLRALRLPPALMCPSQLDRIIPLPCEACPEAPHVTHARYGPGRLRPSSARA